MENNIDNSDKFHVRVLKFTLICSIIKKVETPIRGKNDFNGMYESLYGRNDRARFFKRR